MQPFHHLFAPIVAEALDAKQERAALGYLLAAAAVRPPRRDPWDMPELAIPARRLQHRLRAPLLRRERLETNDALIDAVLSGLILSPPIGSLPTGSLPTGSLPIGDPAIAQDPQQAEAEKEDCAAAVASVLDQHSALIQDNLQAAKHALREAELEIVSGDNLALAYDLFQVKMHRKEFLEIFNDLMILRERILLDKNSRIDKDFVFHNLLHILQNYSSPVLTAHSDAIMDEMGLETLAVQRRFMGLMSFYGLDLFFDRIRKTDPSALDDHPVFQLHAWSARLDQAPALVMGRPPEDRHLIYANLCCWGDSYIALAETALFATLLAPGNMPALAQAHGVVIELITMPEDVGTFASLPTLRALSEYCEIRIFTFPQSVRDGYPKLNWEAFTYLLLGFGFHFTLRRAIRDGADIITLVTDSLMSDGALARVAREVTREPRAVVTEALNCNASGVLKEMAVYRRPGEHPVSLPPRALSASMARHFMPRSKVNLYQRDRRSYPEFPMYFLFPEATGLVVRKLHSIILYASHASFSWMRRFNYGAYDDRFTYHMLDILRDDQIITFESPDDPVIVELSDEVGTLHPEIEGAVTDVLARSFEIGLVASGPLKLLRRERVYHFGREDFPELVDPAERRAFMDTLLRRVETDPVLTELGVLRSQQFARALEARYGAPPPDAGRVA